jgi:parallel beta-helix repeat protein
LHNGGGTGIVLTSSKATVESNTITMAHIGIDFSCSTGNTVLGNTIKETFWGISNVPSSQTVTNTYYNVDFIRAGGC